MKTSMNDRQYLDLAANELEEMHEEMESLNNRLERRERERQREILNQSEFQPTGSN